MPSDEDDRLKFPQRYPDWSSPAKKPSHATISLKKFYILIKQMYFYYILYSDELLSTPSCYLGKARAITVEAFVSFGFSKDTLQDFSVFYSF
jgi:hypothetical protein